jgi:hypothetical protein
LGIIQIPNLAYAIAIATASQATLHIAIAHHGTVPNNPDPVPISLNFFPQQLSTSTTNIPSTIDAPAFVNPMGEFFRVLELEFPVKSLEKFCSLPPSLGRKMKPSKCSIRGFSSFKRILKASQTYKLPIGIFVR